MGAEVCEDWIGTLLSYNQVATGMVPYGTIVSSSSIYLESKLVFPVHVVCFENLHRAACMLCWPVHSELQYPTIDHCVAV